MSLNPGDLISYRLMPETIRYQAIVTSVDEHRITLRLELDAPAVINRGLYVMITEPDTDVEHYNEVAAWDGRTLQLRRMWTGKRGYFRVDDVFPVLHRKMDSDAPSREARIFSGFSATPEEFETPDDSVNPRLWRMLVDMNAKLTLILERLTLEGEGLSAAERIPVNISASGIRFTVSEKVWMGDLMELKMLLPVYPPVGILTCGSVVRIEELDGGNFGVSLRFVDMGDEVRDVIIQYTLRRQREILRRERQWGEND